MKKEEIENRIEKLKLEISDEEIKLKFMNEVGIDNFDENQFKAYKVLQKIKSDLSDVDKLKIIADLMVKPTEPSKYPKELIDLWNRLTKNIVIEHRNGNVYFYDTIKNKVIMQNKKKKLWNVFSNESCLWCRYSEFWSEFIRIIGLRDTDIDEFIQYMVLDTFKLRVYSLDFYFDNLQDSVWDTFKLSTLKT